MNVVFENVLENKEVGRVLDDWTMTYEYDYYRTRFGGYIRHDLQLEEIGLFESLEDVLKDWIETIEAKIEMVWDDEEALEHFTRDLKILKNGLENLE